MKILNSVAAIAVVVIILHLAAAVAVQAQPGKNQQLTVPDEGRDKRDPFVSPIDKMKIKEGKLLQVRELNSLVVLNGILWNEQIPLAIINGELLAEGDGLEDFKVKKIDKERVILEYKGRDVELPLRLDEDTTTN